MSKFLFLFFVLTQIPVEAAQLDVEAIREKYHLPAIGAAIIDDSGVRSEIAGVRKWGDPTPARLADQFHLGSCTKAMTATLLAIFVERGQLRWNARLSDLFPELKTMAPAFREVPLEWLTSMHSGIAESLAPALEKKLWDPKLDPREGRKLVVQEVLSSPPSDPPGSKFVYSNTNYVIAGALLEKLSGKSWETLMVEELFQPLGMKSCGFGPQADPKASPPDEPWPHLFSEGVPRPVTPDFFADNPPTIGPAGTVHCSMADWAKFLRAHLDGARGKNTAILKAESFSALHTSFPDKTFTYGGWVRFEQGGKFALAYTGSNTLNLAEVWIFPGRRVAALGVTNVGSGNAAGTTDDPAFKATDEAIGSVIKRSRAQ